MFISVYNGFCFKCLSHSVPQLYLSRCSNLNSLLIQALARLVSSKSFISKDLDSLIVLPSYRVNGPGSLPHETSNSPNRKGLLRLLLLPALPAWAIISWSVIVKPILDNKFISFRYLKTLVTSELWNRADLTSNTGLGLRLDNFDCYVDKNETI